MSRLLENVARARDRLKEIEEEFNAARIPADRELVKALQKAKPNHSWAELADAAGMSRTGVKWRVTGRTDRERGKNDGS